jgi:2-oxoisovalerate dehydrogenase E1 component beta subunit
MESGAEIAPAERAAATGIWFEDRAGDQIPETMDGARSGGVSYIEALTLALDDELASDSRVILLGEDIGVMGGAFRVTRGLFEKYGENRVIDTPMAEAALVGMAIGMAISGLRPIVELQFADFISCAYDQLVNEAAKLHYRFGIPVPIVVRGPSGAGVGAGPFHSQSPEGIFAHVPGLKVVCPGTVQDAYSLLRAAVADPNPVVFFEHQALYRSLRGPLDRGNEPQAIGRAAIRAEGDRMTLVTYGGLLPACLQVARELAVEDIRICVIDLRSLLPIDHETVRNSVQRTGHVLIVHEDTRTHGVGAEVAAQLAEHAFFDLDGPIVRLAAPDTPVPTSRPLEDAFVPQLSRIREAVMACLSV